MKNFNTSYFVFQNQTIHKRAPLFFSIAILLTTFIIIHITAPQGLCGNETVIIKIQFRDVSEVYPIVKDMVSQNGKVSMDSRTNSIILSDNPESLKHIVGLVRRLDKPPQNVKVTVRLKEIALSQNRSISAGGKISGKNWEIRTHNTDQDSLDIKMEKGATNKTLISEYFIKVTSGNAAYINAGKKIIYNKKWGYLCREYAEYPGDLVLKEIESGFEVKPLIIGDQIQVDIIPRISHEPRRHKQEAIRFTKASTSLLINPGQWVEIGGTDNTDNEVVREILASGSRKKTSSLGISFMVELE